MGKHTKPKDNAKLRSFVLSGSLVAGAAIAMVGMSISETAPKVEQQVAAPAELTADTSVTSDTSGAEDGSQLSSSGNSGQAFPEANLTACPRMARACVDLRAKKSWLQKNGQIEYGPVSINHGQAGWETPTGTFHVYRHVKDEVSMEFYPEKMPWSTYFNTLGIAFHEGDLNQQSHGCIHLSAEAAQHYFKTLKVSETVAVF